MMGIAARRALSSGLVLVAVVAGGCGSTSITAPSTPSVTTASTPSPTLTQLGSAQPLTPGGSTGTTTSPTPLSCGPADQGTATQVYATGVSCATAQQVVSTYIKTVQGGGQGTGGALTVSAANTTFSCSAVAQSGTTTVSCDAPGNPGAVVFKMRM